MIDGLLGIVVTVNLLCTNMNKFIEDIFCVEDTSKFFMWHERVTKINSFSIQQILINHLRQLAVSFHLSSPS
jgi:hypothetical protein